MKTILLTILLSVASITLSAQEVRRGKPAFDPRPTDPIALSVWKEKYAQRVLIINREALPTNGGFGSPTIVLLQQPMYALYAHSDSVEWLYVEEAVALLDGMGTTATEAESAKELAKVRAAVARAKTTLAEVVP